MPYYVVKDFARGLDARRLWETTEVGALIEGFDVHISRGGEAEVRKGFIKQRTLAPGTHGLWVDDDGRQTVFGHTARPALLASDVTYIQCAHPNGVTPMNRVLSQDSFFGKPYIVAEFTDGTVHHYYDGERIRETGLPEDYVPPPEPEPEPEPEPPPPPTYPVGGGRSTAQISLFYAAGGGTTEIKGAGLFKWRTKPGTTNTAELAYYAIMDGPAIAVDQANVSAAVKELADRINAATAGDRKSVV